MMVILHSYVSLPEGTAILCSLQPFASRARRHCRHPGGRDALRGRLSHGHRRRKTVPRRRKPPNMQLNHNWLVDVGG